MPVYNIIDATPLPFITPRARATRAAPALKERSITPCHAVVQRRCCLRYTMPLLIAADGAAAARCYACLPRFSC